MKHVKAHHEISPASHYAVLGSLLISNLTVLGLGILLAGPFTGGSLGYFAYMSEVNKIHKASAAVKGTLSAEALAPRIQPCSTSDGGAVMVGGTKLQRICPPVNIPTAPSAPTKLFVPNAIPVSISLSWTDTSLNETGFSIEKATGTATSTLKWILLGTTSGSDDPTGSYSDSNVVPATSYSYRVRAYNAVGSSSYSNVAVGTTPPAETIPMPPSNLTANAASSTRINLAWLDNSNNEIGFHLERATGTGTSTGAWGNIAMIGQNTTSYADTNGVANASYSYRVRAFNTAGSSSNSNVATATTPAAPTVPAAPTNLVATATSTPDVLLTWNDNSINEQGFKVERATGTPTSTTQWGQIGIQPPNSQPYVDRTGMPSSTYSYRIRAYNNVGNSGYSNVATVTTSASDLISPTVTITVPTSSSGYLASAQLLLMLAGTSSDNTAVTQVRYLCTQGCTAGGIALGTSNWQASNISLVAGINTIRVTAYDAQSNFGQDTIDITYVPTYPETPLNLRANPNTANTSIQVQWVDTADNETGFFLERATGTPTSTISFWSNLFYYPLAANTESITDTNSLVAYTSYVYRVRAINSGGSSSWSNIATAESKGFESAISAPSLISIGSNANHQVTLQWIDNTNIEDGFYVERAPGLTPASSAWRDVGGMARNVVLGGLVNFIDGTATQGQDYSYRVRAYNWQNTSPYSNVSTVHVF